MVRGHTTFDVTQELTDVEMLAWPCLLLSLLLKEMINKQISVLIGPVINITAKNVLPLTFHTNNSNGCWRNSLAGREEGVSGEMV